MSTHAGVSDAAKGLGFNYVWHRAGSFLVRWCDGNKAHEFSTAADLNAIAAAYESVEKQVTGQNHDDRNERGGGVALYIRNGLTFTELAHSDTISPVRPMETEYLMAYIRGGKLDPIFVCVVYRPPGVAFTPSFLNDLKVYCADYSSKIIMRDSRDAGILFDLAGELALKIIYHGPTNFTTQPGTWIDAILTDINDTVLTYDNRAAPYHNQHNLIKVTLDLYSPSLACESFTYRAFNKLSAADLTAVLADCDWASFDSFTATDLESLLRDLTKNITGAINTLAPEKTIQPRKRQPPWINSDINLLTRKRDAAMRRYRGSNDTFFQDKFLRFRKEVSEITAQKRINYTHDKLTDTLENNGNFWKDLRSLGLPPRSASGLHGFSLRAWKMLYILYGLCLSMDFRRPISLSDVILSVAHFSSQARGEDVIPQSVVAKALPTIGPFLVTIFNLLFTNTIFPGAWKRAQLLPLKKKSTPSCPADFRPIALMSFLSKVLEKLVHDQIVEFVVRKGDLDPLQTGFRKDHSTTTALLKLTENIRTGFDKRMVTIALLFDF
ncbi:hypothetical protein TSAR_000211 [Trichomalopsis sarcophagae]|uniref:Uncharacterized protein n=1 Tax=Trichomalopsis sarcophagae TaxID=543379 RepID=A0A232FDI3_9HYME|nr:hypothetical protein TSAR_000211 [Trichomalopsis sarcophagae]